MSRRHNCAAPLELTLSSYLLTFLSELMTLSTFPEGTETTSVLGSAVRVVQRVLHSARRSQTMCVVEAVSQKKETSPRFGRKDILVSTCIRRL